MADGTTFKRVMLKISGEALMGDQGFGLHPPTVERIARDAVGLRQPSPENTTMLRLGVGEARP